MNSISKKAKQIGAACLLVSIATLASAQTSNVIVAKYASLPSSSQSFAINLVNSGQVTEIAGFAFKLKYDPNQVEVTGLSDNTGQAGANVQYTFGKETAEGDGQAERVITATTLTSLKNTSNLVQVNLKKKAGFAMPFKFEVDDRLTSPTVDGLQGANLDNVPHTFDCSALSK